MTEKEVAGLYAEFFRRYDQPNPTDINTVEKAHYLIEIGWEKFRHMLNARKRSHYYTKLSVWKASDT